LIFPAAKIFRRRSEGAAEGGCGGNSAAPEPEAKPRRLLVQSRSQQKSFLFLLEEIGRAQIKNAEKTFLPAGERQRAAAGRSGWFRSGISDKMSSSQVVKTHHNLTFGKLTDHFGGRAKRVPSISPRQILSARRAQARLAVGQDEVRHPRDFNSVSALLCSIIL
jgi:hypothetical protein